MKTTVTRNEFVTQFDNMNRGNHFSINGRIALFEYFEQLENDMNEEIEFDVIGICCEYVEYNDLEEMLEDYPSLKDDVTDLDDLRDYTQVIDVDGSRFIINSYMI